MKFFTDKLHVTFSRSECNNFYEHEILCESEETYKDSISLDEFICAMKNIVVEKEILLMNNDHVCMNFKMLTENKKFQV
jgi:hypothetical protein